MPPTPPPPPPPERLPTHPPALAPTPTLQPVRTAADVLTMNERLKINRRDSAPPTPVPFGNLDVQQPAGEQREEEHPEQLVRECHLDVEATA